MQAPWVTWINTIPLATDTNRLMCDSVWVSWLDNLLHWRECRADMRHNSDGQFLLETFTNLPSK